MKKIVLLSLLSLLQDKLVLGQNFVSCSGTAGLLASYYDTQNPIEPATAREIRTVVDFQEPVGTPLHPSFTSSFTNSLLLNGVFRPLVSGEYRFQTQSDDGSRLYIDGELAVSSWGVQSYSGGLKTGERMYLEAGQDYLLHYDYFQGTAGESRGSLRYSVNNGPFVVVDDTLTHECHYQPQPVTNMDCSLTPSGLTGYYYNSPNFQNLGAVRVDFASSSFGVANNVNPYPGVITDLDNFSVAWKGAFTVASSGLYRFFINSPDVFEVYLSNMLILQNSYDVNIPNKATATFYLTANEYYLVEFRWIETVGSSSFSPVLQSLTNTGTETPLSGGLHLKTCQPNEVVAPVRAKLQGKIGVPIPVSLRTQPIGEVLVVVKTPGNIGAVPCSLVFNPSNWDVSQTVYATTNLTNGELIIFEPTSKFDSNYNSSDAKATTLVFETVAKTCGQTTGASSTCTSWGDPHYISLDGAHFDYHTPSDVYLIRTFDSEFVVQARQSPCGSGKVSCNFAVAIKFKNAIMRIFISAERGNPTLQYNTATSMGSGIDIEKVGLDYKFSFPNGIYIEARTTWWPAGKTYYLSVYMTVPTSYKQNIGGMCGNYDGISTNDYVLKDGSIVTDLLTFGADWTVPSQESLINGDVIIPPLNPVVANSTIPCSYPKCQLPKPIPDSCDSCSIKPPPTIPPTVCTISLASAKQYCADIFLTSTYAMECAKIGVNTTKFYESCVIEVFEMCDKDQATPGACSFQLACSQAPVPQCSCLCNLHGVCVANDVCSCLPDATGENCRNDPDSIPCSIQASPSSGLIGDWVYITVAELKPNKNYRCKFGTKITVNSTDAVWVDENTIKCRAPPRVVAAEVDVIVLVDGVGENCGARFNYTSASGNGDPHFSGFHGEKMEVKKDDLAANQLFHIYCSESISIISLFYEYPDKLLFMTKFWVRLGSTMFTLNLSTQPKVLTPHEPAYFVEETKRFRIDIPDGHLTWDDKKLRVTYKYLKINFSKEVYLNGSPFMNIDFNLIQSPSEKATGIIGRTLENQLSNEQFEQFLQFKAQVNDIISFQCSLPTDLI